MTLNCCSVFFWVCLIWAHTMLSFFTSLHSGLLKKLHQYCIIYKHIYTKYSYAQNMWFRITFWCGIVVIHCNTFVRVKSKQINYINNYIINTVSYILLYTIYYAPHNMTCNSWISLKLSCENIKAKIYLRILNQIDH